MAERAEAGGAMRALGRSALRVATGRLRAVIGLAMVMTAFVAAGDAGWRRGWLLLGLIGTMLLVNLPLVYWKNRVLFRERFRTRYDTKPFDYLFGLIYMIALLVLFLVAGLDGGRYHWSAPPPWSLWLGMALHGLGDVPVVAALLTNPHLETTVRIQTDRGHRVVESGPYRVVRHPMYAGMLIMFLGWPLVLGSLWAYLPYLGVAAVLIWRTAREDRTLLDELPGYAGYAGRTRHRLLPGIW